MFKLIVSQSINKLSFFVHVIFQKLRGFPTMPLSCNKQGMETIFSFLSNTPISQTTYQVLIY